MMFNIQNLTKAHGARTLFADATLQFNPGRRYGVVGANGSGKSSLLRIISGEEEATSGEVAVPKRVTIGVLEQDHFRYEDKRILDVVLMGMPELYEAMQEKEKILENAETHFDAFRYGELEEIVLRYDGYSIESRAAETLEGLNIPAAVHDQPLSTLSGGFKLRVLLAQLLTSRPDVLLLDEPTNHLDIVSIHWLENFLMSYPGCSLIVSHDRTFLNRVATHIVDVDYARITMYTGNYEAFEHAKLAERELREREISKREQEIADHKAFIDRFKAKATKARQAKSKAKRVEKIVIEPLEPSSRQHPNFSLQQKRPSGKEVLKVEGISKAYDDKQVLTDVGLTVNREDRLAIIGPNGVGKSTLLKIIMEEVAADSGSFEWGYETHPGYFSQDHDEVHSAERITLMDWLWSFCPDGSVGWVRHKLAEVLFGQDDVGKLVGALSGGEVARLIFAKLGVLSPNVLILDEPTNHLDLEGIEALAAGLERFDGTIIFVSHDRWFVSQLATRVLEITHEGVDDFQGSYERFLEHKAIDHLER